MKQTVNVQRKMELCELKRSGRASCKRVHQYPPSLLLKSPKTRSPEGLDILPRASVLAANAKALVYQVLFLQFPAP